MNKKKPVIHHPGKILKEEFLIPARTNSAQLAKDIGISRRIIQEIITEKKDLTKEIAASLAVYFSTAPNFWINLQSNYDEEQVEKILYKISEKAVRPLSYF